MLGKGAEIDKFQREANAQQQRDGEGGKREKRESCFEREPACEDIDVASVDKLRKC